MLKRWLLDDISLTWYNCRVKKMTTWWYIAHVIQSPLPWCHLIYQIVAVYWRLKLPWKSAYEIIPANWKSLAPTLHLHFFRFQLLQKRFQIIYKSQENCWKFVLTDVNQTNQMSRTWSGLTEFLLLQFFRTGLNVSLSHKITSRKTACLWYTFITNPQY